MIIDNAKEAVKQLNKQKFLKEIEKAVDENKKLGYAITNIQYNISNADDIDPTAMSTLQGIRRDILLDLEYTKRIEKLLGIGGAVNAKRDYT